MIITNSWKRYLARRIVSAHRLTAGSTTLLFRGIPVKPGGGFGAELPSPGGGGGMAGGGLGAVAFTGKEVLNPVRGTQITATLIHNMFQMLEQNKSVTASIKLSIVSRC